MAHNDDLRAAVERLREWLEARSDPFGPNAHDYTFRHRHKDDGVVYTPYRVMLAELNRLTDLLAQHPPETAPPEAQSGIAEWRCVHGVELERPCAGCDAAPASRGDASPETAPPPLAMDGTIVTPEYVEANRDLVETPEEIARLRGIMEKWAPKPGVTLNFMRLCDSHEAMRRRYETRVCATCIHDRYRPECGQRVVRPNNVDFMREGGSRDTFGCPLHAPAEPMPSGYVQSSSRGDASRAGTCATCVAFWAYTNGIDQPMAIGTCRKGVSQSHDQHPAGPTRVSTDFGCNQWAGADAPKENN